MKPFKLNVKTKDENYPIIIGSNIITNLAIYFKENSINILYLEEKNNNLNVPGNIAIAHHLIKAWATKEVN